MPVINILMAATTIERAETHISVLDPEIIYTITDTIPSIGKLATLAVLDQTPGDFVSGRVISQRLETLQGLYPTWRFSSDSPTMALSYCEDLFAPLGLATLGQAPGFHNLARGARITPDGSELWPAIAGAYLPWQEDNPHIRLSDVVGFSQQALKGGISNRVRVLELLSHHPRTKFSITRIYETLDVNVRQASNIIADLSRAGLVAYRSSRISPNERTFVVKGPVDVPDVSKKAMTDELRALTRFLEDADYDAGTVLNLPSMITMAQSVLPDADPRILWDSLRRWLDHASIRKTGQFLEELKPKPTERRASIVPEFKGSIADILKRREALANDPEYRDEVSTIGRKYMKNIKRVNTAMVAAKHESKQPTADLVEWELTLLQHLPVDGMYLDELYQTVQDNTRITITREAFSRRIRTLDELLIVENRRDEHGVLLKPFVAWQNKSFYAEWLDKAQCNQPHIDPEIFHPDKSKPLDVQRRDLADAVFTCLRCEGRLACLTTSLQAEDTEAIRAGLTPTQLQAVSPTQKRTLLSVVSIK